jgi:DNA polymerase
MSRQRAYLEAMGVDLYVRRDGGTETHMTAPPGAAAMSDPATVAAPLPATEMTAAPTSSTLPSPTAAPAASTAADSTAADSTDGPDLDGLRAQVAGCTRCPLHGSRTQTVFGVGNPRARILVVGEAPGAEEDRQGEPFVGRAGQLLNSMLRAIGLPREEVYIANILKCRPPENRVPQPEEMLACSPYLERQIALIRPTLLLAVGRIAAQALLQTTTPIGSLRGQRHRYGAAGIPLVVTYHPAYLLRSPREKRKAWHDLCLVRQVAGESEGGG